MFKNSKCSSPTNYGGHGSSGDSEARWLISYYYFRMGCDPPFFVARGVTPHSEIIGGKCYHWFR